MGEGREGREKRQDKGKITHAIWYMQHVSYPDASDGIMVLGRNADRVALVRNADLSKVIHAHDCVPSIVDVRKFVLRGIF